jgi:hypothetical protein
VSYQEIVKFQPLQCNLFLEPFPNETTRIQKSLFIEKIDWDMLPRNDFLLPLPLFANTTKLPKDFAIVCDD